MLAGLAEDEGNADQQARTLFPATLGTLDFWFRGDEPDCGFSVVSATQRYRRVRQRGAQTPALLTTGGADVAITTRGASSRRAPLHTAGQALVGTTATAARMHQSGTDGALCWAMYLDSAGVAGRPARTGLTDGFNIVRTATNRVTVDVYDANVARLGIGSAAATTVTTGLFTCILEKAGLAYSLYINGALYASGSAASLGSSATSTDSLSIGGTPVGVAPLPGSVCEMFLAQRVLSAGEKTSVDSYLSGRWS